MNPELRTVRTRVVVHGRVQGVFFRDGCRRTARALGLRGWVRNRADGTVEAVFEGAAEPVARAVAWCREGPPYARVDRLEIFDEPPESLAGFMIRA